MAEDGALNAFLVVAFIESGTPVRPTQMTVIRLIRHLRPKGSYSVTTSRQQGLALMCGFELEEDATKFAAAVRAKPIGKYGGWKSQRGFVLDGRKYAAILKLVAAPPT